MAALDTANTSTAITNSATTTTTATATTTATTAMNVHAAHFILYVANQSRSRQFYAEALAMQPRLDVPGMTEFALANGCVLGLMPQAGIRALLGEQLPDPARAQGVPRCELYLLVDDPGAAHQRALQSGATELSALAPRGWGHDAAYSLDPDGHVLAFAKVA